MRTGATEDGSEILEGSKSWLQRARAARAIVSATSRLSGNLQQQQQVAPRLVHRFIGSICPPVPAARLLLAVCGQLDSILGGDSWPKLDGQLAESGTRGIEHDMIRVGTMVSHFRQLVVAAILVSVEK
jgi:hypothetical protein